MSIRRTIRGKERAGTRRKPDPDYLPEHVAQAFEFHLDRLIADLGDTGGFKGAYLRSEYKTKYNDPKGVSPEQRRTAAIEKWLSTERRNQQTNQRLQLGDVDFGWVTSDDLIRKVRSFVAEALGPLDYPQILDRGGYTTGASTRVRRGPDALILKHAGKAHVSTSAVKHWLQYAKNSILSDQCMQIQESSVLFTVPKATEIDRVACKEPDINMFLQRSIGTHIRRRLRRRGVDLNDQTVNQNLAKDALSLGLATIDLSAASDSITRQLVIELLPFDWWNLLDDLRVHSAEVDGSTHELEMFSSMGNGFTFELESLLFWALCRGIMYFSGCKGKLSVYGDDIILPSEIAPRMTRIFAWFGFKVNPKKSNWSGSFRESCGKHYYRNLEVTPFYVREPISRKTDVIRLLNRLLEWDGRGWGFLTTPSVAEFHYHWARVIPKPLWGGQDPKDKAALVTGDSPRSRLVSRDKEVEYPHAAAMAAWLTKRRFMGDSPLTLDPRKEGRYVIVPQPSWTVRTAWDPWLIHGSAQCDVTP